MQNLNEKVRKLLNEGEVGLTNIKLSQEEIDKFNSKLGNKRVLDRGKVNIINLIGDTLTIEIIDVKAFRDELFDVVDKFIKTEELYQKALYFPEDVEDIIEAHKVSKYLDVLGKDLMDRSGNTRYRGRLINVHGEPTKASLSKEFIARYEVLIFRKSNMPYARLTRLSEDYKLYQPSGNGFVREGSDSVVCLYKNLDRLMRVNDISDTDILINDDSIKEFYSFDNTFFVNPTTKWVEMWWNYDCPVLYRYIPNIQGTTNSWGIGPVCWESLLVESGWSYTNIAEDITETEVRQFAGKYIHTETYKQMRNVLIARGITEEEKKKRIGKAEKLEKKIQKIINENEKEILFEAAKNITGKEFKAENLKGLKKIISEQDGTMGLDCGFLYISLTDEVDLFKEVANYDTDSFRMKNGAMKLQLPISVQSTTIMKSVASAIRNLVESQTHHKVNYWTVLD